MKSLQKSLISLLLLFATTLLSASTYINVANVKTKKELSYPYKKLKSMGLKMFYKQKSFGYSAYVGPFSSTNALRSAYKRVKRSFPRAKIISNSKTTTKRTKQRKQVSHHHSLYHNGFIAGLGIGYGEAPSSHIIQEGSVTINEPENAGISYTLYGGYDFENSFSILLNYMYLDATDLEFHNIYTSLLYRFEKFETLVPYFGASVGYSSLKWNTSPIEEASPSSNNNSADIMYGTEVGFNYTLTQTIALKLNYNCLFLNHTTNIEQSSTNRSKLEHNTLHSITTSIQYNF